LIDYESITGILNNLIKAETTHPVMLQGIISKQPPYPFCSYTIISPFLPQSSIDQGETFTQDVEIVISYTWVSDDPFKVMSLAQKTASFLQHSSTRQKLSDAKIAVVRIDGFGNRDTFLSIETERRTGFDLRIRIRTEDSRNLEVIETVNLVGG
jgi:mRNA deadenylase 3'-5' endonuclease subunit Ccr4